MGSFGEALRLFTLGVVIAGTANALFGKDKQTVAGLKVVSDFGKSIWKTSVTGK